MQAKVTCHDIGRQAAPIVYIGQIINWFQTVEYFRRTSELTVYDRIALQVPCLILRVHNRIHIIALKHENYEVEIEIID